MRRLGDDHVVGLVRREQDVTRVVLVEAEARVALRVVVHVDEEPRRLHDGGLDLGGGDVPDARRQRRAYGHTAPPADDEHVLRARRDEERDLR